MLIINKVTWLKTRGSGENLKNETYLFTTSPKALGTRLSVVIYNISGDSGPRYNNCNRHLLSQWSDFAGVPALVNWTHVPYCIIELFEQNEIDID